MAPARAHARRRISRVLIATLCALEVVIIAGVSDARASTVAWVRESPASAPSARSGAAMAYDAAHQTSVLFGGVGNATVGDTWTWNGTAWQEMSPTTSPSPRTGAAMAYDTAAGTLLLFGGSDANGIPQSDTWTWTGSDWSQVSAQIAPSPRYGASMAYLKGQLVLFGGSDTLGVQADTWTWNGTAWTLLTPATSPPARTGAVLAPDPAGNLVLFGGATSNNSALGDTWIWDGTNWTQRSPAVAPSARTEASAAYDRLLGSLVLFGGNDGVNALQDTYFWTGSTWVQQAPVSNPAPRYGAAMAYSDASPGLFLYGGAGSGASARSDTWVFAPVPQITGIDPVGGPTAGGTSVTVTGSALTGASAVYFGAIPATSFRVVSDTRITATAPARPDGSEGTVDVTVTTPGGRTAAGSSDRFTYFARPGLVTVNPAAGPITGGTTVTIHGTAFTGSTSVAFGSVPASSFSVTSDTSITAVTPAEGAGTVDTIVSSAKGPSAATSNDQFSFDAIPAVTGIAPAQGPASGATSVVISGSAFTGATAVMFGSLPATGFTVDSPTQITAVSPASAAGPVDLTVTTPGGTSAAVPGDRFTYQPVPVVTAVDPATIPMSGGTALTLSGSGLTGATSVSFGGTPAAAFSVTSDTAIRAVSPAHAAGTVDVVVATAAGPSATSGGDRVTFVAPNPSIVLPLAYLLPTGAFMVSGGGFRANEPLEVFLDRSDLASTVSDGLGRVPQVGLQVPPAAAAGTHWVTVMDAAAGLSAQASFVVRGAWSADGFDSAHAGLNPYENNLSNLNASHLVQAWAGTAGAPLQGGVGVSQKGAVWTASSNGRLYAFSATPCGQATCATVATASTGGPVGAPTIYGDVVYAGSADGKLYAFDAGCTGTCAATWTAAPGGGALSTPAIGAGTLFAGSGSGNLYALPLGCGKPSCSPLWTAHTGGAIASAPAIFGGQVVVGSADGSVYAFDVATGKPVWKGVTGGAIEGSPAISAGFVYVASADHQVYSYALTCAIEGRGCTPTWIGATWGSLGTSPAVGYGQVLVGAEDGTLYAFSTQGCSGWPCSPLWHVTTTGAVEGAPALADGEAYVASKDGRVYAFNARKGTLDWSSATAGPITASTAVANGSLYVASADGSLHVYAAPGYAAAPARPSPSSLSPLGTPIRHVVVIYQENHSFDDVLGALCAQGRNCDGATSGMLPNGTRIPLKQAPDLVPAVDHGTAAHTTALDGGKMDGFGLNGGCTAATGYACYMQYQPSQIPNLAALATHFSVSDRFFEAGATPSWGSHLDLAAAQLDGFLGDNPVAPAAHKADPGFTGWGCESFKDMRWRATVADRWTWQPSCVPAQDGSGPYRPSKVGWVPTIMDRMDAAGQSWRIYSGGPDLGGARYGWGICPTFADCLYGPQASNVSSSANVLADAAAGSLPSLSLVMPELKDSQHNDYSMTRGDNWIGSVVSAIMNGPEWNSTAIFITYDDCGCFYDHVPPPSADMGLRVPMVIVSPYVRAGATDSNVATSASLLAFTEHTLSLPPLFTTDANAYDFAQSFNYSQVRIAPVALQPHPVPAQSTQAIEANPPPPEDT